jgi:hypothetical protein
VAALGDRIVLGLFSTTIVRHSTLLSSSRERPDGVRNQCAMPGPSNAGKAIKTSTAA